MKKACADPTAATFCAGIVTACNGAGGDELTKTQCETIVKGLTAVGRGHFKGCVEENVGDGQCKYGSAECFYRFQ